MPYHYGGKKKMKKGKKKVRKMKRKPITKRKRR